MDTKISPYTVTFVSDLFTLRMGVELDLLESDIANADGEQLEQVAMDLAKNMLLFHYGIDIAKIADEIEATQG